MANVAGLFNTAAPIAVQVAAAVFGSGNMPAEPGITLDEIRFTGTGIPEQVKFGIKEQHVVHKMIGGARIVDMLGDDPEDISWSGVFLGPDAAEQIAGIYAKVQEKKLVDLTFGTYKASVVITQFDVVYRRPYLCDYSITCVVLDQAAIQAADLGIVAQQEATIFVALAQVAALITLNNVALLTTINGPIDAANALRAGAGLLLANGLAGLGGAAPLVGYV